MLELAKYLPDEAAQEALGSELARLCDQGLVIFLKGELGAGKTTFARGFLRGLGYTGKVKSPTYTLVEEYVFPEKTCFHFDLYRLADPEELEFMGIRDFLLDRDILLIEWPEQGTGFLPDPDVQIDITYENTARKLVLKARTLKGNHILKQLHL